MFVDIGIGWVCWVCWGGWYKCIGNLFVGLGNVIIVEYLYGYDECDWLCVVDIRVYGDGDGWIYFGLVIIIILFFILSILFY